MSTPKKKTKTTRAALAAQMATGTAKHLQGSAQLPVAGVSLTPAQIEAKLQGYAALRAGVEAAHVALDAKLAAEDQAAPEMNAFLGAFEQVVRGSFGNQPDVLTDFGLAPQKPRTPLSVEKKAAAAAKRASTREKRGTKGRKAKQSIHGDVTGVVVTPVKATPPATPPAETTATSASATPAAPSAATPTTPHS